MVDITITAANVVPLDSAPPRNEYIFGRAGGTITAGMPVYQATDGDYEAAQADAASTDQVVGIAVNSASSGQGLKIQTKGKVTIGGTVAVGTLYVLSAAAAGGIAADADLTTGNYFTAIGVGISTGAIWLTIAPTGTTHA